MNNTEEILKFLKEIDEEAWMCCSTTMDPEYIKEQTEKIRKIINK